jgi:phosphate/sulfate permease
MHTCTPSYSFHTYIYTHIYTHIHTYIQVISAICVIFAHGAGEVGYMSGPLAVIYNVVQNPGNNVVTANSKVQPEIWIILIGAFGLVIGLATYGTFCIYIYIYMYIR